MYLWREVSAVIYLSFDQDWAPEWATQEVVELVELLVLLNVQVVVDRIIVLYYSSY